jgi:hypothetical protein
VHLLLGHQQQGSKGRGRGRGGHTLGPLSGVHTPDRCIPTAVISRRPETALVQKENPISRQGCHQTTYASGGEPPFPVFGCDDEANTTAQLMLILSGSGPVIVLVALHALEGERMQMVNRAAHLQWLLIAGPQPRPRQETYSCLPQAQPGSPPSPCPPGRTPCRTSSCPPAPPCSCP